MGSKEAELVKEAAFAPASPPGSSPGGTDVLTYWPMQAMHSFDCLGAMLLAALPTGQLKHQVLASAALAPAGGAVSPTNPNLPAGHVSSTLICTAQADCLLEELYLPAGQTTQTANMLASYASLRYLPAGQPVHCVAG